jgi:hypothetical protein
MTTTGRTEYALRLLLSTVGTVQFSELLFDKSGHGRIGSEYSVYLGDGDGGVPYQYHLSQWDGMLSKHGHCKYLQGSYEASSYHPCTRRRGTGDYSVAIAVTSTNIRKHMHALYCEVFSSNKIRQSSCAFKKQKKRLYCVVEPERSIHACWSIYVWLICCRCRHIYHLVYVYK